jgi:hypothetical protein
MRLDPLPTPADRAEAYDLLANAELIRLERLLRETRGEPVAARVRKAARLVEGAERAVVMAEFLRRRQQ